ncbi:histidine kinase [Paenibacillus alkaliterrae]|uniref:histidine kinase n=1 Tax=Paenibacillus alkaliterrae TaxID=320909 RepID=UPI001F3B00C5|nr:histidine kinase [Paenibacillus alkaliterrae]MCF2941582.1 histidine kinase [Paenibacillus alkaliterrae]
MSKHDDLFQDLKQIRDTWAQVDYLGPNSVIPEWSELKEEYDTLRNKIENENEIVAFKKILKNTVTGVLHSVLVMIDGGTELAEKFNIDLVIMGTGESMRENIALHEEFIGYLLDAEDNSLVN